ncbi:hypothetical protein N1028_05530 [Herbiconiux sp. CPCC 203407]|uniref:Lipoprotein n=1 Tax=Herbiconiux oxytropis TaxID=2970915 RepID=A0AA41XHX9_9MICO|nr:hypothetical protein [Herbiconiux oxytropis]MCS5722654.1 hypothetical protein [Herbiconiux oxytropis]MCS5725351.1 hypothetical protein [Herbiconiux oxytropis]
MIPKRSAMSRAARAGGTVAVAAALLTASGCAAEAEAPGTQAGASPIASPTATSTPTPDPTALAEAAAAADEALLPFAAEEIREWAPTAVPSSDSEGFASAFSGWMSEHTAKNHRSTDNSAEAGSYLVQIACRGEGTITVETSTLDGQPASDPVVCRNSTIAFDATTPTEGLVTELALDGAPTIYALSFQHAPAG